jgi:hypothetical protein
MLNPSCVANVKQPTDLFEAQMVRFVLVGRSARPIVEEIADAARYYLEKQAAWLTLPSIFPTGLEDWRGGR